MELALIAALSTAGLFAAMLLFAEIGRRIGLARLARDASSLAAGTSAAEGAVFGLLGLLIAFSFSGAASRFEDRRHLIVEEANAIGTAYLRLELLPAGPRTELQALFRRYLDVRIATYRQDTLGASEAKRAEGTALQEEIWSKALAASLAPEIPPPTVGLVLSPLNEMIDITATRVMATLNHPPPIVFMLLGGVGIIGALLVGYGTSINRNRGWFHTVMFAAILSITVYVIIDMEFPRVGLIQVDAADQVLIEVRESMR